MQHVIDTALSLQARRVIVMKDGQVVESGSVDQILNRPQQPYTRMLVEAVYEKK